jgi:uncharacterized protein (DUF952 family)
VIYHIVARATWEAARAAGSYRSDTLATEGFTHCSRREQVVATANRYYRGRRGLVLLGIEPARVGPEIKSELSARGELFPHIYGPLEADAVRLVLPFEPGADGTFALPAELSDPASS